MKIQEGDLSPECFQRFSSLRSLIRAATVLIHIARPHKHSNQPNGCKGWHRCNLPCTPDELSQAKDVIIRAAQQETFPEDFTLLSAGKTVAKDYKYSSEVQSYP